MTPPRPPDDELDIGPACARAAADVQRLLDGEPLPDDAESLRHRRDCPECLSWLASARELRRGLGFLYAPPVDLADRVADEAVRGRRRRLVVRRAAAGLLALAAAVVLVVWLARPRSGDPVPAPGPGPSPDITQTPPLRESISEATSALVALTRRAADEAVPPLPTPASVRAPVIAVPETLQAKLEPAAASLSEVRYGARSGFEPMADSFRRAFGMLSRELPNLSPSEPEPRSMP